MTEALRPLLESCAYNILGSVEDARDVVQDIVLKMLDKPLEEIENPKAYLLRAVTNQAINLKKRRELQRREYPGSWLPEPVETDRALLQKDILNYSLMVLLEKLNASERAVFILREAFAYSHEEIAEALDISPANSRQLLRRARLGLKDAGAKAAARTAFRPDQFLSLIRNRDIDRLEKLLTDDIAITSDGGGKVLANRRPVIGKPLALRYLLGVYEKYQKQNEFAVAEINHQPALLHYREGLLISCQVFHLNERGLAAIYFIRNPDKLRNLVTHGRRFLS